MPRVFLLCIVSVLVVVVEVVDLSSASAIRDEEYPATELQVTAGRDTPVKWPASLTAGRRRRSAESDGYEYAVIIDAGSTGSRVRVYRWPTPKGTARVALQSTGVEEVHNKKVEPGLSSAANLQKISDDIHTLLTEAAQYVPEPLQPKSPVYLMATGGQSRLCINHRARQLYNNISMLFLFPVIDGKLSTGVNATFNASCYG